MRAVISVTALAAILSALAPWYSDYLQGRSLQQAESGYRAESLHSAASAVSFNPLSINGLFVLAGAQQRLGYEPAARETLLEATRRQPLNYKVWEQLATYERDFWGETDLSRQHFEVAVNLNPRDKQLREKAGP